MSKLRVGVLRGGPSSEYDISLKTGSHVLHNLSPDAYITHDILISKDGVWHMRGFENSPEKILKNVDVVFNALHGEYGEDGEVQKILNAFQVPYTGSGVLASKVAMNKAKAKEIMSKAGIRTPLHIIIERSSGLDKVITEVFRAFPQPVVIKPIGSGSSVGVVLADSFGSLVKGVTDALEQYPSVLIEEYIRGREATCGVIEGYRGEEHYALFPIEIVLPKESKLFDYDAKYSGKTEENCPGDFTQDEKEELQNLTKKIHQELGLRHYSRSDFIVTPRGIYFLEANTLPGLTEESLVPLALRETGCTFPEFLDHLISLAVNKK